MMAYHLHASPEKISLCINKISNMPLELLQVEVQQALRKISPNQTTTSVSYCGITYKAGMVLLYRCSGGLPDFAEIMQIIMQFHCQDL